LPADRCIFDTSAKHLIFQRLYGAISIKYPVHSIKRRLRAGDSGCATKERAFSPG
jgi:hypothetical protein